MKSLLPLFSLLALTAGRRHLCADLTLPVCSGPGILPYPVDYRVVWRNKGHGNVNGGHGCEHGGVPTCGDGSTPQRVFNVCPNDQKQCPQGQGQCIGDICSKPFDACPGGHQPLCPSMKPNTCAFKNKRCPPYGKDDKPRRQCKKGRPHCPWFTRNRNKEWANPRTDFNHGDIRPQNRANGNGRPALSPLPANRPCDGNCPCDNVHLFNATLTPTSPPTSIEASWQACGSSCDADFNLFTGERFCFFWEFTKKGPNAGLCRRVSNYRKGVGNGFGDYKVVSGSYECV